MTDDTSQVDNKTLLDCIERGGETGKLARAEIERRLQGKINGQPNLS